MPYICSFRHQNPRVNPDLSVPGSPDAAGVGQARLLALSTSGEWCSVALHGHFGGADDSECLSERLGAGQSERILAMVRELCAGARIELSALDAIAFDAGPGSFTGLRVGCAVAQGLGFALNLPLIAVDGLAALAWQRLRASRRGEGVVLAATDARMNEIYVAMYHVRSGESSGARALAARGREEKVDAIAGAAPLVDALIAPRLCRRADWLHELAQCWTAAPGAPQESLAAEQVLLGGNAWQMPGLLDEWVTHHALVTRPAVPGEDEAYVRADALAELAMRSWRSGAVLAAAAAAPRYVRDKVALDRDEQRALRERRAAIARAAEGLHR
jgi:tRNA threonylcarbamoyladenosine biosynthesis protein TsaB